MFQLKDTMALCQSDFRQLDRCLTFLKICNPMRRLNTWYLLFFLPSSVGSWSYRPHPGWWSDWWDCYWSRGPVVQFWIPTNVQECRPRWSDSVDAHWITPTLWCFRSISNPTGMYNPALSQCRVDFVIRCVWKLCNSIEKTCLWRHPARNAQWCSSIGSVEI